VTFTGVLLLASLGGLTPLPGSVVAATVVSQADAPAALPRTRFGMSLDAGVPDGVGIAFRYRPVHWLRVDAGLTNNAGAYGVRGGFSLAPFYFPITPTAGIDVGQTFQGNYVAGYKRLGVDLTEAATLFHDMTYFYANAHVGFEIGSARRFVFFLRGGLSYVSLKAPGFEAFLQEQAEDPSVTVRVERARGTMPSGKLGFTFYFH